MNSPDETVYVTHIPNAIHQAYTANAMITIYYP